MYRSNSYIHDIHVHILYWHTPDLANKWHFRKHCLYLHWCSFAFTIITVSEYKLIDFVRACQETPDDLSLCYLNFYRIRLWFHLAILHDFHQCWLKSHINSNMLSMVLVEYCKIVCNEICTSLTGLWKDGIRHWYFFEC